jgi:uncharacterized SAM-binding protein YcdF (DUF218 family)
MDKVDIAAKNIWDYMIVGQKIRKCDAILALGSIDDRVASYAADLFLQGYGNWLILSGGVAHKNDLLKTNYDEISEAEHFAEIAIEKGVPKDKIITEKKATNTGENARFVYKILERNNIQIKSVLLVQKPYMERRAYATFAKQWPVKDTKFIVTSPKLSYEKYFNKTQPKDKVINIMVGDLQRIIEYPRLGYQIKQDIPKKVLDAFHYLIQAGYNKHITKQ